MAAIEWKKLCCPIDFSEPSRAALRVAADLSRRFGAELTLFVADGEPPKIAGAEGEAPAGPRASTDLEGWKREAEALGAPRVATARAAGQPELAIVEFAERQGIDLIVMGTHGRTGRDRSLVGSVAEAVVRRAGCPVLTVHAAWRAGPGERPATSR